MPWQGVTGGENGLMFEEPPPDLYWVASGPSTAIERTRRGSTGSSLPRFFTRVIARSSIARVVAACAGLSICPSSSR